MRGNESGFTLIELLIVVVIIGILATIAIPKFSSTREKSMVSTVRSDLRNLASQQEIYFSANMAYASTVTQLTMTVTQDVTIDIGEATNLGWSATAVHAGLTGESCAIYLGNAAAVTPAASKGVVYCTR